MLRKLIFILALLSLSSLSGPTFADGGYSNEKNSPLAPVQILIEDEKYQDAISELQQLLKETPTDADMLNLLAYSQRKLQRFDEALVNYQKALDIEPEHRGANEYLGELYLQLGQLDKAQERLQVLDKACFFGCDEFDELEEAIKAYQGRNSS
jgi:tetratricopeptide (TPR) repeat protein